jgi:hypothetical protein
VADGFKFFLHEDVTFLPDLNYILIGNLEETLSNVKSVEELRFIKEDNFFEL